MAERLSRDALLDARLSDLTGYWLEIRCGRRCGSSVFYPCKLMAKERGGALRVRDMIERLRCKQCRGTPAHVLITGDPTGGTQGGNQEAWKVALVP